MSNSNAETKTLIANQVELLLKVTTIALGVMYVLGLLITNVQFMELGVADFSSLRARNIMIGFLFILYFVFLLVILSPLATAVSACYCIIKTTKLRGVFRKTLASLGTVVIGLFITTLFSNVVGIVIGFMYPWGRPWSAAYKAGLWKWTFIKSDSITSYMQLSDAYWHLKIIIASLVITVSLVLFMNTLIHSVMKRTSHSPGTSMQDDTMSSYFRKVSFPRIGFFFLVLALPLLLFDYSYEVYPNLKYNLGGGQPKITELHMEKIDTAFARFLGVKTSSNVTEQIVITEPVALWYQDKDFLYLSPLLNVKQNLTRMVAVDSKIVRAIYYLPGYVRVRSGGQILSVQLQ